MALNLWLQASICIWQSVQPNKPEQAYAIGEMLEDFLCDEDTEHFKVKNHEAELDSRTPKIKAGSTFASMARALKATNTHKKSGARRRHRNSVGDTSPTEEPAEKKKVVQIVLPASDKSQEGGASSGGVHFSSSETKDEGDAGTEDDEVYSHSILKIPADFVPTPYDTYDAESESHVLSEPVSLGKQSELSSRSANSSGAVSMKSALSLKSAKSSIGAAGLELRTVKVRFESSCVV